MNKSNTIARRNLLKRAGLLIASGGMWLEGLYRGVTNADEKRPTAEAGITGRREILKGLDGMSRAGAPVTNAFTSGHVAAAVISSGFFCREQNLDVETQKEMLSFVETRLLTKPIFAPLPNERSDPELLNGFVQDLDAGIDVLRTSGHNIIFAVISLKALRAAPEAATPTRIKGLRQMVQSFGKSNLRGNRFQGDSHLDLGDEQAFIRFALEEYLGALELYLNGKGHHGFAGHLLTVGHALLELYRMGYKETAQKGVTAYLQFVEQARQGANLGGKKVSDAPPGAPNPLMREYWVEQDNRRPNELVDSHLIKYPFSFYALAKELREDALKQRIFERIYYLTAIS